MSPKKNITAAGAKGHGKITAPPILILTGRAIDTATGGVYRDDINEQLVVLSRSDAQSEGYRKLIEETLGLKPQERAKLTTENGFEQAYGLRTLVYEPSDVKQLARLPNALIVDENSINFPKIKLELGKLRDKKATNFLQDGTAISPLP